MRTKQILTVNKSTVLNYVSQESIFEKYLGIYPKSGSFKNPLRVDEKPGCSFIGAKGKIYFKDYSKNKLYDCFDIVCEKFNCSLREAIGIVASDFNVNGYAIAGEKREVSISSTFVQQDSHFTSELRRFYSNEIKFWNPEGMNITEQILHENGIFAASNIKDQFRTIDNLKMVFAYVENNKINQLYFPNNKGTNRLRFRTASRMKLGGLSWALPPNECDYIVITKSKKDSFFLKMLGVNCCYVVSESIILTEEVFKKLNYKKVFTLFDNDYPGKRLSVQYKHIHKTIPLLFPKDMKKDVSDNLFFSGYTKIKELVDNTFKFLKL